MLGRAAGVGVLIAAAGCGFPSTYACAGADQCRSRGEVGVCEPEGFCSYADDECASGRRFSSLAGDGLAGDCVASDGSSSSTTSSDASTSSVTAATTTGCTPVPWYLDADGDGFGDPDSSQDGCVAPEGHVDDDTDCDDSDPRINPDGLGCPLSGDLIAWYRLDDASGSATIEDAAGSFDGTVNAASAELGVEGVFGTALSNDGTDFAAMLEGLADAVSPMGSTLATGTLEAWVRIAAAPDDAAMIVYLGSATENGFGQQRGIHLHASDDQGLRLQAWVAGSEFDESRCSIRTEPLRGGYGEWFHVAVTWDNGECAFYLDGQLVDTDVLMTPIGGPLAIARMGGPGLSTRILFGEIDEVMVWRRARTAAEVISDCGACP